jgi:predicted ATPase/DNA-binding CsgD family transcriptional regulator
MSSTSSHRHNLPAQVSSFIGRKGELEEIARLLRQHRLITLTGVGGAGKTRLALRAVAAELDEFRDGAWLVELASLAAPELVVGAIARAVGAPKAATDDPLDVLGAFLSGKRLLLVLDNCEHLLAECARVVAYLLSRCPSLVVLTTSREPLAIAGEAVLRVPPLTLPDPAQTLDAERLIEYDAVRLFVERAQAAEPSFHFSQVTAESVVEICRRLDGVPLALELAAVRVRGMGVAYLNARLDDRFRLLKGADAGAEPRQRTLLALVDWSYDLLAPREQVVLRRLSIFTGSFPTEAAEAVCSGAYDGPDGRVEVGADDVLDDLTRLVDKSLAQFDHTTGRYRLLETIRLFGKQRLSDAGVSGTLSERHCAYYLRFVEEGAVLIGGPDQQAWFTRLETEHDNLRAALAWAIQAGRGDEAARLALGLWRYWHARTYQREGVRWLERILALDEARLLPDALRPRLFNALGVLAHRAGRFDRAHACHAEALRLWTAANDRAGMAQALFDIAWQQFDEVKLEPATQSAREALSLAESIGDERLIASALLVAGLAGVQSGAADIVIPDIERSLVLWRDLSDPDNVAATLAVLASGHQQCGEYERARPLLAESARLNMRLGSYGNLISTLVALMYQTAAAADRLEMAQDAARVIGMMDAWEETTSGTPSPWWATPDGRAIRSKITQRLGAEATTQAIAEGKRLTTAEFLALVDRVTAPAADIAPARAAHAALTPREHEVLHLVAQGLTNAEIARKLIITPRTVNAHLTAIYAKLGVAGRSAAIRYALEYRLG